MTARRVVLLAASCLAFLSPGAASSQSSAGFGNPAAVQLSSLNIPADRLGKWWDPQPVIDDYDTFQGATEINVGCAANPCSRGSSYTGFSTSVCSTVTAPSAANLQCMITNAPDFSALLIPAGTYEISSTLIVRRSNLVIRGEGHTTILERQSNGRARDTDCDVNWAGASIISICDTDALGGTASDWTAGWSEGDTVLTVADTAAFPVTTQVVLDMAKSDTGCALVDETNGDSFFAHIARVTSRSVASGAGTITIDRPLLFDYDATGCAGTVWARARSMDPIHTIGIEDMHLTTDSGLTLCSENQDTSSPTQAPVSGQDCDDLGQYKRTHLAMEHVSESWIVGVKFSRTYQRWTNTWFSSRIWFQGNDFEESGLNTKDLSEGNQLRASTDVVYENNTCTNSVVCFQSQQAARAAVYGYNYLENRHISADDNCYNAGSDQTFPATCEAEKGIFQHGKGGSALLAEGNDLDSRISISDVVWNRPLDFNTYYRNRLRAPGTAAADCTGPNHGVISADVWSDKDQPAPRTAIIGNTVLAFGARPFDGTGCSPYAPNHSLNEFITNLWIEKNAYRIASGWHVLNGTGNDATTSCGTAEGDTCPGTNVQRDDPDPSWATLDAPTSLYRSAKPDWWCGPGSDADLCDWDHDGIGAFGDDFGGTLCKLPAQIRSEGGTCTTS